MSTPQSVVSPGADLAPGPVGGPTRSARRSLLSSRFNGWALLVLPGVLLLALMFGYPLYEIGKMSFTEPSASENWSLFTETTIYRSAFITTFRISAITTVVCLLVAYPYAFLMYRSGKWAVALLGFLVLIPFWTSSLVRTYAWTMWLQDGGIINDALHALGFGPVELIRNDIATTIGMTNIMAPYMVLTLYAGMRRIDPSLMPAAQSLGATPAKAFAQVFLPLTKSAIFAGCLIVFVISLGFYITPAILGNATKPMVSQQIADLVSRQGNFGGGATIGIALLVLTLVILAVASRVVRIQNVVGMKEE